MAWGSLALSVHDGATDMHNRKVNVQLLHEVILVDIFTRRLYVNSCKAYTLISGHPGGGGVTLRNPRSFSRRGLQIPLVKTNIV